MNHVLKSDMERGAERSQVIDVAKGFLMLLVVIGHAIQFVGYMGNSNFWSDPLLILIYIFHMPLFMAFSGYLSPQRVINWLDIYRRIKTLIYPMFVFGGFVAVIRGCYKGDYFSILYGALDGFLNIYWFLWATLLCYVIVGLSEKAKSGAVVAYIFAFALMVFFRDSWVVLPMLAFVLPFFVICRWARRSGRFSKWALVLDLSKVWDVVLFLGVVVCFYFWGIDCYVYNNRINIIDYPLQICVMYVAGGVSSIFWGRYIVALAGKCIDTVVGAWLGLVGKRTLEIYLVQGVVFTFVGAVLRKCGDWSGVDAPVKWIISVLFALALVAVILPMVEYSYKSKILSKLVWGR